MSTGRRKNMHRLWVELSLLMLSSILFTWSLCILLWSVLAANISFWLLFNWRNTCFACVIPGWKFHPELNWSSWSDSSFTVLVIVVVREGNTQSLQPPRQLGGSCPTRADCYENQLWSLCVNWQDANLAADLRLVHRRHLRGCTTTNIPDEQRFLGLMWIPVMSPFESLTVPLRCPDMFYVCPSTGALSAIFSQLHSFSFVYAQGGNIWLDNNKT